jgi:hypothetical protein
VGWFAEVGAARHEEVVRYGREAGDVKLSTVGSTGEVASHDLVLEPGCIKEEALRWIQLGFVPEGISRNAGLAVAPFRSASFSSPWRRHELACSLERDRGRIVTEASRKGCSV